MREKGRLTSARAVALTALYRVDQRVPTSIWSSANSSDQAELPARDRAFATELAYGTLRWRGRIDWVLSHFVRRSLASQHPYVRNILRLGAYQLLFLPNVPAAAAVNESVRLAKGHEAARHAAPFVNAVLRKVAREGIGLAPPSVADDEAAALSVETSHPEWMVRRWLGQYGPDVVRPLLLANNEPAPLSVRVNTLRASVETLLAASTGKASRLSRRLCCQGACGWRARPAWRASASFRDGWFTAQDEGSQVVAYAVDPRPGETVWDMCSAPGTKTTHMAELMGDEGRIVAVDIHAERLRLVDEGCKRLGLGSVRTVQGDASGAGRSAGFCR